MRELILIYATAMFAAAGGTEQDLAIPRAETVALAPQAQAHAGLDKLRAPGFSYAGSRNEVISILAARVDESIRTGGTGTPSVSPDPINRKTGPIGWRFDMGAAGAGLFVWQPAEQLTLPPVAVVGMWIYVPENEVLTSMTLTLFSATEQWNATASSFTRGWNLIRWTAGRSTYAALASIIKARFQVTTTASSSVTLGSLFVECPPKARIVVVNDGAAYSTFILGSYGGVTPRGTPFSGGYPDLKKLGIPVVLAPDTRAAGTGTFPDDRATWEQLAALIADGNKNEMNYHGSSGKPTANMSAADITVEVMTAIRDLEAHGYPNPPIKAAWSQNTAPNAWAVRGFMLGYASSNNLSGSLHEMWPFASPWDFGRYELAARPPEEIDAWFSALEATHELTVVYIHEVNPSGRFNVTPAQWGYFLDKASAAISAGWLEFVTFNQLLARDGARSRKVPGGWLWEYFDPAGTAHQMILP